MFLKCAGLCCVTSFGSQALVENLPTNLAPLIYQKLREGGPPTKGTPKKGKRENRISIPNPWPALRGLGVRGLV